MNLNVMYSKIKSIMQIQDSKTIKVNINSKIPANSFIDYIFMV